MVLCCRAFVVRAARTADFFIFEHGLFVLGVVMKLSFFKKKPPFTNL
jgi:hypothetical protein